MKRKPTGFVAICQCGNKIGSMDFERTDKKEAGKIISKWLLNGCVIEPRFTGSWHDLILSCRCE